MRAVLETLCGCRRYEDVDPYQHEVSVALLAPISLRENACSEYCTKPYMRRRVFRKTSSEISGLPVLREVWDD